MNDNTSKMEDRFHSLDPASKKFEAGIGVKPVGPIFKTGLMSQKIPQQKADIQMKFLPEGKQIHECKQRDYKFTHDKDYPVLERKDYRIKTRDDNGREMWMKEDYFTTANQLLMHDKDCGFTTKKQSDTLVWNGLDIPATVPEIRKVSFAKKTVCDPFTGADYQTPLSDLKVLSGVKNKDNIPVRSDAEIIELKSEKTKEELEKNKAHFEQVTAPLNSIYQTDSFGNQTDSFGKVNPLLMDFDKLAENMGKVFTEYRKVDTDGLMTYIRSKVPGHKIEWNHGVLTVDGAKTNIVRTDVNVAFDGLKKLASPKMADKLIGKVIVAKLKKLF